LQVHVSPDPFSQKCKIFNIVGNSQHMFMVLPQ